MPVPKQNESKESFIERCIPYVIKEGKSKEQAYAICNSLYDNKKE